MTPRPEWIGHRGAPRLAMENTVESLTTAFDLGADAVELDVHVTADGVPIVHHDPDVPADATPIAAGGKALKALTAADVARVSIPPRWRIPTLAEVLDALHARGRVYVEIKGGSEAAVVDTIRASRAADQCAIHSFDHALIMRLRDAAPEIPRGLLYERASRRIESDLRESSAAYLWPSFKIVDAGMVALARERGARVNVWTVNQASVATTVKTLGVDGICTDDLDIARA